MHDFQLSDGVHYSVNCATEDDIGWIAQNAKRVYKDLDIIPQEIMLEWYKANPKGFWIAKNKRGDCCGNLDLLPLKPDAMQKFIDGKIIEREIQGNFIYSQADRDKIELIYIESLIALNPNSLKAGNFLVLYELVKNFYDIVSDLCNPGNIKRIYAMAASEAGTRILTKLGFSMMGKHKGQGHNIYQVDGQFFLNRIRSKRYSLRNRN